MAILFIYKNLTILVRLKIIVKRKKMCIMDITYIKDTMENRGLSKIKNYLYKGQGSEEIKVNEEKILEIKRDFMSFIEKKTNQISTAVYLVSDIMSDKNPLKDSLRAVAIDLIKDIYILPTLSSFEKFFHIEYVEGRLAETLSLLQIAVYSGEISEENHAILEKETLFLKVVLKRSRQERWQGALAQYKDDEVEGRGAFDFGNLFDEKKDGPIGQKNTGKEVSSLKDISKPIKDNLKDISINDKTDRKNAIISIIKKKGEAGIKDILPHIPDCSEKTVQRDLQSLVLKGLLLKKGEKRWATYTIKDDKNS